MSTIAMSSQKKGRVTEYLLVLLDSFFRFDRMTCCCCKKIHTSHNCTGTSTSTCRGISDVNNNPKNVYARMLERVPVRVLLLCRRRRDS